MTRSMRCPMGCRLRAGLKPSALHITQRSTTCQRRQGPARPGTETNRETTSLRQTHLRLTLKPPLVKHLPLKPQLFQRTPQLRIRVRLGVGAARILPPSVTPNLPPHHLRQPTPPTERPATQAESASPRPVSGASPSRHPLPRSALHLHFTADHIQHVAELRVRMGFDPGMPRNLPTPKRRRPRRPIIRGHPLLPTERE